MHHNNLTEVKFIYLDGGNVLVKRNSVDGDHIANELGFDPLDYEKIVEAVAATQPQEEITIDYSAIEGDKRWEMKCNCGTENCRGIIGSTHSLPEEQFMKYMPNVSTYFKNLYFKNQGRKLKPI